MAALHSATLGAKGQVTLPKGVRKFLGLHQPGEMVGFLVDEEVRTVRLTRLRVVPEEDDLGEKEYRKLLELPKRKGGKTFSSMKALLKDLKKA